MRKGEVSLLRDLSRPPEFPLGAQVSFIDYKATMNIEMITRLRLPFCMPASSNPSRLL